MLCFEYATLQEAQKAVATLNNHWGFQVKNPNASKFTESFIIESDNKWYIIYDEIWTYILGVPVNIEITSFNDL